MADSSDIESQSAASLANALAEIAELVKPIAAEENKISLDAFYYLLLLWGGIHIYPLEPPPETLPGGGGESGIAVVIPLENGWKIFDYGDCLSASPGEEYGNYCTGKLITAAQEIINMLIIRGVTKVSMLGHDIARRAAWIECYEHGIEIINYDPTDFDWQARARIIEAREAARKKAVKKPQVPGA